MIKITMEEIVNICKVKTPEDYSEDGEYSDLYSAVLRECRSEGLTEEEAEEKAMEAEQEQSDEDYAKYVDRILTVFSEEIEHIGLEMEPLKTKPGVYGITPKTTWRDSAHGIRDLVNGISGFYFTTLDEFLSSGPYTPRQAIQSHIGYIGRRHELYGYSSPRNRIYG